MSTRLKLLLRIRKLIISGLLLISSLLTYSSITKDSLKISILTCSPGEELYSTFGHTAVRVVDYKNRLDLVFNYGSFDFDTPNFYGKFVKGKLKYQLSISSFENFKLSYISENRSIYEQDLNMSDEGKSRMFSFLKTNYLPENRYYLYDFFLNNCTSVVRDILKNNPENTNCFNNTDVLTDLSFRNYLRPCLKDREWVRFGMDLVMGYPSDKAATLYQSMFLPYNLMQELDQINCGGRSICSKTKTIFEAELSEGKPAKKPGPATFFWIIFLIVFLISIFKLKTEKHSFLFDKIFFSILGIFGFLLLFLWLGTDHWTMGKNLNLFWAIPLHFPLLLLIKYINKGFVRYYFLFTAILSGSILLGWNIYPQEFHPAIIPILLIIFVRAAIIYFKLGKIAD